MAPTYEKEFAANDLFAISSGSLECGTQFEKRRTLEGDGKLDGIL